MRSCPTSGTKQGQLHRRSKTRPILQVTNLTSLVGGTNHARSSSAPHARTQIHATTLPQPPTHTTNTIIAHHLGAFHDDWGLGVLQIPILRLIWWQIYSNTTNGSERTRTYTLASTHFDAFFGWQVSKSSASDHNQRRARTPQEIKAMERAFHENALSRKAAEGSSSSVPLYSLLWCL